MLNNIEYTSQKGQDKWVIEDIFKGKIYQNLNSQT